MNPPPSLARLFRWYLRALLLAVTVTLAALIWKSDDPRVARWFDHEQIAP